MKSILAYKSLFADSNGPKSHHELVMYNNKKIKKKKKKKKDRNHHIQPVEPQ